MEHRLQRCWLVIILAIKEFYLQEIMSVIKVIGEEITDKFLDNHPFLILQVCVKAGNKGIHLFVDRRVVSNLGLNHCVLFRLRVLGAELGSRFAILIDFLLKCNLREIQLITFG